MILNMSTNYVGLNFVFARDPYNNMVLMIKWAKHLYTYRLQIMCLLCVLW